MEPVFLWGLAGPWSNEIRNANVRTALDTVDSFDRIVVVSCGHCLGTEQQALSARYCAGRMAASACRALGQSEPMADVVAGEPAFLYGAAGVLRLGRPEPVLD